MPSTDPPANGQRRVERLVHFSLLAGLVVAGLLLAAGLLAALVAGEADVDGRPASLPQLFQAALSGDGQALMQFGLLALMMTPLLQVAALALGWTASGERRFALVALAVLMLLILGLFLGVK